ANLASAPLTGTQSIIVRGNCTGNTQLYVPTSQTNKGKIYLTDDCGTYAWLNASGSTFTKSGTLPITNTYLTARYVTDTIKITNLALRIAVTANAPSTQTSTGSFTTYIQNSGDYGTWSGATAATLDGSVKAKKLKGYVLTPGNVLTVLTASSVTGTFAKNAG